MPVARIFIIFHCSGREATIRDYNTAYNLWPRSVPLAANTYCMMEAWKALATFAPRARVQCSGACEQSH